MRVLRGIPELGQIPGPLCVAIGVFDGVHLGHEALIRRVMAEAEERNGHAVVLTFDPHPVKVLRPDRAPHLLTSLAHKEKLITALGCPVLLIQPFDQAFAAQPPEKFIADLVAGARDLRCLCVGHQWTFGRERSGNTDLLRRLGAESGFQTVEIDPVQADGETVSSTRIRRAIKAGDFAAARKMLGRDYSILGTVRRGAQLGTKLGFPTANLAAHNEQFPPDGVYAVHADLRGQAHGGVANIGIRPTVDGNSGRVLEVHLFDFSGDCYGEDLELRFERFLRAEQKFDSVEALKAQIGKDAATARSVLAG